MYVVDRLEKDLIIIEDRETKEIKEIDKNLLPNNIKEGDILTLIDKEYIIDRKETNEIKNKIRNRFNKLRKN